MLPPRFRDALLAAPHGLIEHWLESNALVHFHIHTESMKPCLQPGDEIGVVGAWVEQVPPGSLVVLRRGEVWIVHRLLRRSREGDSWKLLTKGDRASMCDSVWEKVNRVGVVQTVQRGERRFDLTSAGVKRIGRVLAALSSCEARLSVGTPGRPLRGVRRLVRWVGCLLARGGYGR